MNNRRERSDRPERSDRGERGGGRPGGRPGGPGGPGRGPGGPGAKRSFHRKRVCIYCKNKDLFIDYKDAKALRPYLTERGRIMPRRISGACAKHQRAIATAIKRARNIALVPFTTISM
jgi:small subunit ribosomal protein S18